MGLKVLEANTEIIKNNNLIMVIKTLLNIIFIALQINRESV